MSQDVICVTWVKTRGRKHRAEEIQIQEMPALPLARIALARRASTTLSDNAQHMTE